MTRVSTSRSDRAIHISSAILVGLVLVLVLDFTFHFNWKTFLPDLLVGLATGLVVGVVLAQSQSRAERSVDRRDMTIAWRSLSSRVIVQALNITTSPSEYKHASLTSYMSQFGKLEKLLRDKPVGVWAEELALPELKHLSNFATLFPAFKRQTELTERLLDLKLTTKLGINRQAGYDPQILAVAIRRLMGQPQLTNVPDPAAHATWIKAADEILDENPRYRELLANIKDLAQDVEAAAHAMTRPNSPSARR